MCIRDSFEVLNNATNPAYSDGYVDGGRLVCSFLLGGNCSIGTANVPVSYTHLSPFTI